MQMITMTNAQPQNLTAEQAAIANLVKDAREGKGIDALTAAFATVTDSDNWRFGVEAVIEGEMTDADYITTMAAIRFFTLGDFVSIRETDRTEFHSEGFLMNTHDDPCPFSRAELEMVESIAQAAGFPDSYASLPEAA